MVIWRRKPKNPDPAIKVTIAGFGLDNHAAFPIRLVEPITVHHVIERKPIPRPDYIRVQFMRSDGTYHEYIMQVGHWYESGLMHVPEECTDVRMQYHYGNE